MKIKVILFIGLVLLIVHLIVNRDSMIVEHLTGKPTLTGLQKEVDDLKQEMADMKSQASQGAAAASAARLQIGAIKSGSSTS
jgi:cell division protein FtsB